MHTEVRIGPKNVKVIAALRQDLLTKVLHQDPVPGFQEEKYESLYLKLNWSKKDLHKLVEKRINLLVKRQYTGNEVSFRDIFSARINNEDALDYVTERSFLRPRDVISFLNECIALAEGRTSIPATTIKNAEESYSQKRLQSLANEWQTVYPNLIYVSRLFYGMKSAFPVSEITREWLEERYTVVATNIVDSRADPITREIDKLYAATSNFESVRAFVIRELCITGLIGIKTGSSSPVNWSHLSTLTPAAGEVRPSSGVYVHHMFHRALGIQTS